jgi:hypothetical protein
MIGLIVLALLIFWLLVSFAISRFIVRAIQIKKGRFILWVFIYSLVVIIPFLDEIIGRYQFKSLCNNKAITWVSPNIGEIEAAHDGDSDISFIRGFIIPIREQKEITLDAYTGEVIHQFSAFHTKGGWIMRAGLGLGHSTSCWPKDWRSRDHGFDLNKLMEKGKSVSRDSGS